MKYLITNQNIYKSKFPFFHELNFLKKLIKQGGRVGEYWNFQKWGVTQNWGGGVVLTPLRTMYW